MNNKGFTLVELLVCLVIIGIVAGVSFGLVRGTWSKPVDTLNEVSENEISNAAKNYVIENSVSWKLDGDNIYSCVSINDMINDGYFNSKELIDYQNMFVKVIKNNNTKVIIDTELLEECN